MGLRLITPPTAPAVAVSDIKADLRVDHNDDDALIAAYLDASTQWVEERLEKKLMTQSWEFVIDEFPCNEIMLPLGPVQTLTAIHYFDPSTLEMLLPASDYYLDNTSRDPWVFPQAAWPTTQTAVNAVRIEFVVGYPTAAKIPQPITQAIRLLVREAYDGSAVEKTVDRLLLPFLRMSA